jgi:hypothetical protein
MTPGWALASSSLFYLRHFSSFHFFMMTSSRRLAAECTCRMYCLSQVNLTRARSGKSP